MPLCRRLAVPISSLCLVLLYPATGTMDITAPHPVLTTVVTQLLPRLNADAAAKEAAASWRFTPALDGGKPVRSMVRVPVTFVAE